MFELVKLVHRVSDEYKFYMNKRELLPIGTFNVTLRVEIDIVKRIFARYPIMAIYLIWEDFILPVK